MDSGPQGNSRGKAAKRAKGNAFGTTGDQNLVTFVLFVVRKCLTTKDTKHTKEEIQREPRERRSWHNKWSELSYLRALRGETLLDHEGREVHEGRNTKGTKGKAFLAQEVVRTS